MPLYFSKLASMPDTPESYYPRPRFEFTCAAHLQLIVGAMWAESDSWLDADEPFDPLAEAPGAAEALARHTAPYSTRLFVDGDGPIEAYATVGEALETHADWWAIHRGTTAPEYGGAAECLVLTYNLEGTEFWALYLIRPNANAPKYVVRPNER